MSDPDDVGIYLIRACGFIPSSSFPPGIGLHGLALSSPSTLDIDFSRLIAQPALLVPDGPPLKHDEFRTHCVRLPSLLMASYINHLHMISNEIDPRTLYPTHGHDDANQSVKTRSQTTILAGDSPSCPDDGVAVLSGFAEPTASAPPLLCPSAPSRSTRVGSTTPGCPALPLLASPPSEPMMLMSRPQLSTFPMAFCAMKHADTFNSVALNPSHTRFATISHSRA